MINWDKLQPYGTSKEKSFEELCYQVAKTLYGHLGRFTSIDDSGGGDGVEFYLDLSDGTQWGWQAKFYLPGPAGRLSEGGRKPSIKGSLDKALKVHPKMTRWFLCTPRTFTPEEHKWFCGMEVDKQGRTQLVLPASIPDGRNVELTHWNESDFGTWISEPRLSGKRHYFFGELELDRGWFERLLDRQRPHVSGEYLAELHVKTGVDRALNSHLGGPESCHAARLYIAEVKKNVEQILELTADHAGTVGVETPRHCAQAWLDGMVDLHAQLDKAFNAFEAGDFAVLASLPVADCRARIEGLFTGLRQACDRRLPPMLHENRFRAETDLEPEAPAPDKDVELLRRLMGMARGGLVGARATLTTFEKMQSPDLHLYGNAGVGKTNAVFDLCHQLVTTGRPAIFVSARGMRDGLALTEQLRQRLDIPPAYSWDNFLGALSAAAQAHRTRLPVVIDGLNESGPIGSDNLWATDLQGLIELFKTHPGLLLVTTCRSSYLEAIWPQGWPHGLVEVYGFVTEVSEAVERYFKHYRLDADLSRAPLQQFAHPIYLRLFCETHNPERRELTPVHFGETSLYKVFDRYLEQINGKVVAKANARLGKQLVRPILDQLAEVLWTEGARNVAIDDFITWADGSSDVPWINSKAEALLSEGLVAQRDYQKGADRVGFTYDLLGGYLIASWLMKRHHADLRGFLCNPATGRALLNQGGSAHPLAEDVGRCLAALCARERGRHLHEVSGDDHYKVYVVPMVFELPATLIAGRERSLVREAFLRTEQSFQVLGWARPVLFAPEHPLNAHFWSGLLKTLRVTERDLTWSEAVRANHDFFLHLIDDLERDSRSTELEIADGRVNLMAEVVAWLQTTSVRTLRDLGTRALHWYARRRPADFLEMLRRLLNVNDPYVVERLLATACAASLASRVDSDDSEFMRVHLPALARLIYTAFFGVDARHATPHILARDYARRVIETAVARQPQMFLPDELDRARTPYPADLTRVWGQSQDQDQGRYGAGDGPLGTDFNNYTLGRLVRERRNYDDNNPDFQVVRAHIWWRIYQLGYRLDDFSKIDQQIAEAHYGGRGEDGQKTERYGKKYAWIAYYELAGTLFDTGQTDRDAGEYVDFDPSFPQRPQEHVLMHDDWLEPEVKETSRWIVDGALPEVRPLLTRPQLLALPGPWVLLDGYVLQISELVGRERFTFLRSFLVAETDFDGFMERFGQQSFAGRWLPEKPIVHDMYAADLPPTLMFPEWGEITFRRTVREALVDSRRTSQASPQEVLQRMSRRRNDESAQQKWSKLVPVERDRIETITYSVIQPVLEGTWAAYKSAANPEWGVTVPARALIEGLGLRQRPYSFNFEGSDGELCSLSFQASLEGKSRQNFVYLRQNALEEFLTNRGMRLVWAVWGERTLSTQRFIQGNQFRTPGADQHQEANYKVFQQIFTYEAGGGIRDISTALGRLGGEE